MLLFIIPGCRCRQHSIDSTLVNSSSHLQYSYHTPGTTPRAVAVVQREGIPGGTTVLPALQVIGHRLRLPLEEGPRDLAAAAAEGIAPGQDLRRARGGTTGRDRAPLTDLTGGSDRARPRPRRRTARRTPAVHARLFLCHRAGECNQSTDF